MDSATMNDLKLDYDAFLRSLKQNSDVEHVMLIGAGASISSGVQSAGDCIWEWKKDIFVSNNPTLSIQYHEHQLSVVRESVQKWLDDEGGYPPKGISNEYSSYAEIAYPIESVRKKYFENLCKDKVPEIGYHLLCLLAKKGVFRSVFTTNFDGLMVKAAHKNDITPIEISLDSTDRIYRALTNNELFCISLHGDFKYGPLKNTSKELDCQHDDFVQALSHQLNDRHLIVQGYSGRDKSLMSALEKAYSKKGSGVLFWCGYGDEINSEVVQLIQSIRSNGRNAFYIATDGFDETMLHVAKSCFVNDEQYQLDLEIILKASHKNEFVKEPFKITSTHTSAVLRSNLFPIAVPKEVFQFNAEFEKGEKIWSTVRELTKSEELVAVPLKRMVYAIGTLSCVHDVFGSRINGDIKRTPVDFNELKSGSPMKSLYFMALMKGITKNRELCFDGYNLIWKESERVDIQLGDQWVKVFSAAKCSLFFDHKYPYLAISPSFHLEGYKEFSRDDRLTIARSYYNMLFKGKPNPGYDAFLQKWRKTLFPNENRLKFEFPNNSGSGFKFQVSHDTAHVSIMNPKYRYGKSIPMGVNEKTILYKGIQYIEPELLFMDARGENNVKDFHPMRGLKKNRPYDYFLNGNVHDSEVNLGIICPESYEVSLFDFLNRLNEQQSSGGINPDYLIDYPGFYQAFDVNLNIPNQKSELWKSYATGLIDSGKSIQSIGLDLLADIKKKIDSFDQVPKKLVLVILIPSELNRYTLSEKDREKFDLHNHIKAYGAQKGIATQFIQEDTLRDPLICQISWWLSLSFYVETLRTPWVLSGLDNTTAFVGIGYSVNHRASREKVVLGCSHIYSANGEGLKYKLTKVDDCYLDKRNNPFLSYDDSYKFGIAIREMFYSAMGELPKRVVVHKRTPFKRDEVSGITESLKRSGIIDVDLVEINFEDSARFLNLNLKSDSAPHNFPVSRGTCFLIDKYTALLFTHGIVPSVKEDYRSYFLGGKNVPVPLKIKKHYGKTNINSLATEILGLTKMNWNSFDLYTKLPATIQTSNEIAKIGWLLSRFKGRTYDYRHFM